MIRAPRSISFSFTAIRSTIRFPYTFPIDIIVVVDIMFNIIFVAVPAFILVDPATISGPVSAAMTLSTEVDR